MANEFLVRVVVTKDLCLMSILRASLLQLVIGCHEGSRHERRRWADRHIELPTRKAVRSAIRPGGSAVVVVPAGCTG